MKLKDLIIFHLNIINFCLLELFFSFNIKFLIFIIRFINIYIYIFHHAITRQHDQAQRRVDDRTMNIGLILISLNFFFN